MAQYRKRPVIIEAVQWTGSNFEEICSTFNSLDVSCNIVWSPEKETLAIPTLEGTMLANIGDWIIRGVAGEVYPCKPNIFEKTYEVVSDVLEYPTLKEVEEADHFQICKWYRFLPSPGAGAFEREQAILNKIDEKFRRAGGMTPEISKQLGWGND